MTYVKRATTLVLSFLLVVSIATLTGSIVHFQGSLTNLNDIISDRDYQITKLHKEGDSFRYNISGLSEIINIQIVREENLSDQFIDLKGEKETLEDEKADLEKDLSDTVEDLADAESEISDLHEEIAGLIDDNKDLNKTLTDVIDDVEDICDDASALNLSKCEDYS